MTKKKPDAKIGRPPKRPEERADVNFTGRSTRAERDAWEAAAESAGLSLSDWLRGLANRAAKRGKPT